MLTSPEQVVREFWRLMASNDFAAVAAVLDEEFILDWPQSGERVRGPHNFAVLNQEYPAAGPWRFTLNRLVADDMEVVTDVTVTDGAQTARAISFFTVAEGRIQRILEFWPEPYDAPHDRTDIVELIHE